MNNSAMKAIRIDPRLILCRIALEESSDFITTQNFLCESKDPDQWLIFVPLKSCLSPDFLDVAREFIDSRPDLEIFYADEVEHLDAEKAAKFILKPDFNFTMLLSHDYVGFPLFIKHQLFTRLGGLKNECKTAKLYDFVLRAYAEGAAIGRVAKLLLANHAGRQRASFHDLRAVAAAWVAKNLRDHEVKEGRTTSSLQIRRRFSEFPRVCLVIPTRQGPQEVTRDKTYGRPHILNLLDSLEKTEWPKDALRVIVGDDNSDASIYANLCCPFKVDIVHMVQDTEGFNYAAKMNKLWRKADCEYIVFMNDDVLVKNSDWLAALMTFAMNDDVGGVGARLLYPNGRIQHAGIPGGIFGACAHAWLNQEGEAPTYENWAEIHREWSMVTGAVFATRASNLEAVGGFDERLRLEYNDIDLCLRMRILGYRIVYTPFAELLHYEKSSRGEVKPQGNEVALFLNRWSDFLERDPAFHPGFERFLFDIAPVAKSEAWFSA